MLAGAHQEILSHSTSRNILDLKVQYKHKIKLPLNMVSKHVFLYLCLPEYETSKSNILY